MSAHPQGSPPPDSTLSSRTRSATCCKRSSLCNCCCAPPSPTTPKPSVVDHWLLLLHQSEISCAASDAGCLGANISRRRTRGECVCCRAAAASSAVVGPLRSSVPVAKYWRTTDDPVREVRSRYKHIPGKNRALRQRHGRIGASA